MRKASILIMVLWVIAVLSIMALSFATEAHLTAGVNVYVRERFRVNRLVDAGQALAEVILADFTSAPDWREDEDPVELDEEDRWYLFKRQLKDDSKCKIGPVLLDESNPESGTVTIEIRLSNAGSDHALNVNELYQNGDQNFRLRWEMLLSSHGLPEDFEVEVEDIGRVKLKDHLIACWNDWRDEDDLVSGTSLGFEEECGAESKWYEEYYEEEKIEDEDRRYPRNGRIPDIQELAYIRGFKDYPAILTGGVINPEEKDEKQRITVTGITEMLGVSGSSKINVNDCTVEQLLTVPGIFDEDDDESLSESRSAAQAILDTLKVPPEHRDDYDTTRSWWPYKDFSDLCQRVSDNYSNVHIDSEAGNYLEFTPKQDSLFKLTITGESMGMSHVVEAEGYVKDKKVRYTKWRED